MILVDVTKFCESNNIRYFLCAGSMLGAVRHKGFIPWDDDIDISMPRPDYNRFIKEYGNERYMVHCWDNDHQFLCPYAKVEDTRTNLIENSDFGRSIGVNIDVFPVDGLPKDEKQIIHTVNIMKALWGLVVCATVKDISQRTVIRKIEITTMRAFYRLFHSESFFTGLTIKKAQQYSFDDSEKVAVLVWGYGKKEVVDYATASEYIKAEFEGHQFNIPKYYDKYLSSLYGDYMKLPPEEQRVNKHHAMAYWK